MKEIENLQKQWNNILVQFNALEIKTATIAKELEGKTAAIATALESVHGKANTVAKELEVKTAEIATALEIDHATKEAKVKKIIENINTKLTICLWILSVVACYVIYKLW